MKPVHLTARLTDVLADGPVDLHAHLLPEAGLSLPTARGIVAVETAPHRLRLGDVEVALSVASICDPELLIADMDERGLAVRAVSPPPFAFAVDARGQEAADYAHAINEQLSEMCVASGGRLVGLGVVPLNEPALAVRELDRLASLPGIAGLAVPPLLHDRSLDCDPLRACLAGAAARDLSVLVHPMQLPRPELARHYLSNLVGNPVETAVGVASLLLGGVLEEAPELRVCFVHGGGCTPALLGRWDHGWRARGDVRLQSSEVPSASVHRLFFDTLTHGVHELRHVARRFDPESLVLGSDYPFDMGEQDPVGFAELAELDVEQLARNARRFLGVPAPVQAPLAERGR